MTLTRHVALLATLLVGSAAHAADELPNTAVYLGAFGGGNLVLTDWDMGETDADGFHVSPDSSPIFGLRVGLALNHWVAIEGAAAWLPFQADGESNNAFAYQGDLLISLMEGDIVPFLDIGAGTYHNPDADGDPDADPQFHWGLGIKAMSTDRFAVRADARHVMSDALGDDVVNHNLELTVGVDFYLWVSEAPPPPDQDADGVVDADDACPTVAGTGATKGCPDADGDGIVDADDACPQAAGAGVHRGCPDTDEDGIIDGEDARPKSAGKAEDKGCPKKDSDGDGVLDEADACPEVAGDAKLGGCPDGDGDGIVDGEDRCPKVAGVKAHAGCAPPPVEVVKRFSGRIEGVTFESGTDDLTPPSRTKLDEVAGTMKAFPELRFRVEGHTDSSGRREANMELSQKRADAVVSYLGEKGIDPARLKPVGLGPDKPVEDNKTKKGRALNRRIEFHILDGK